MHLSGRPPWAPAHHPSNSLHICSIKSRWKYDTSAQPLLMRTHKAVRTTGVSRDARFQNRDVQRHIWRTRRAERSFLYFLLRQRCNEIQGVHVHFTALRNAGLSAELVWGRLVFTSQYPILCHVPLMIFVRCRGPGQIWRRYCVACFRRSGLTVRPAL